MSDDDGINIRRLLLSDLEQVHALEVRAQPLPWTMDMMQLEFMVEHAVILGAFDDALTGYVAVRKQLDELWVMNLAVDPHKRRRGVARALLAALHPTGLALSCVSIWLEVREGNTGARALYQHFGFCEVARRPAYYRPVPPAAAAEAAVVMSVPVELSGLDGKVAAK
jgi:[ribosomal protein S18]-alanine N-acetyltransferase